jgi:two-component system, cell cycle sensor histidine kinase and response regulator CckA
MLRAAHIPGEDRDKMVDRNGFLEALGIQAAVIKTDGEIVQVNEAWRNFAHWGGSAEEDAYLGDNYYDVCESVNGVDTVLARRASQGLRDVAAGVAPSFSLEYPCHAPDARRWFRLLAVPLDLKDGLVLVLHAPSAGERNDVMLRLGEQTAYSLIASAPMFIVLADREGRIQFINQVHESVHTRAEVEGSILTEFLAPEFREDARLALSAAFEGDASELRIKDASGRRWFHVRVGPVQPNPGEEITAAFWIANDITERKHLEEQLRQSQKMEAIGRLAGGVAHDFNNLLTVISGHAELLTYTLTEVKYRAHVEQILASAKRAADLTHQLLAFSRKQVMQPKRLDLSVTVRESSKMFTRLIGEDIVVKLELEPGLYPVMADPVQIEQVLLNLAVNARDAMPNGGKLTFETSNVDLPGDYADKCFELKAGRYVMVAITDSGTGMTPEAMSRIWEPFFTTKKLGTGLGLSMTQGIVKQSGGHVSVYSEPGHGTCFKIYLPAADVGEVAAYAALPEHEDSMGTETVLLVEDDESVRALTTQLLESRGYAVHSVTCPREALSLYDTLESKPLLLLTDMIMPEMSGKELADLLLQQQPDLRVIFMSGYTDDAIGHHGLLASDVHFIHKPFSVKQLARKVRTVLDAD